MFISALLYNEKVCVFTFNYTGAKWDASYYWDVSYYCHNNLKSNNHFQNKILLLASKYICIFSDSHLINRECLNNPFGIIS